MHIYCVCGGFHPPADIDCILGERYNLISSLMSTLVMSMGRCRGSKAGLGRSDVRPCQTEYCPCLSMIVNDHQ